MTQNTPMPPNFNDVLNFWFSETTKPFWFAKSDDFDTKLSMLFQQTLHQAQSGELSFWRTQNGKPSARGRLAEIIVLDQFSRNLYRNTPAAFAQDGMALVLAQELIALELDSTLSADERHFAYLPFMHSESLVIHDTAVQLYTQLGRQSALDFEHRHRDIIAQFGRYPHRNAILGRTSTPEELLFLQQPNSGF